MLDKTSSTAVRGLPAPEPTRVQVQIPRFHPAQVRLWKMPGKFKAARCGRRWGKNVFGESIAVSDACRGRFVGWFAPENKRLSESYNVIREALLPVMKSSDKTHGIIKTITGGRVEFWTMEDENAGRSRKYHRAIMDEVAFTKPGALDVWTRSIKPTLLDWDGSALAMSNTNGIDPENFLWQICNQPEHGFVDFHAPTTSNPLIPLRGPREGYAAWQERRDAYFADLISRTPPLVYEQEFLAEFVDWSGAAFFSRDKLLVNGEPIDPPVRCEAVFAVIDTATKTGKENDGTGVVFCALIRNPVRPVGPDGTLAEPPHRLVILDWDVSQIEGALLETWLPTVFQQLEHMARTCRARMGSIGAFIEDKNSGMVLIQQALRRGWPATAIDSKLTKVGKDERAISVSGYVYRDMVKLSRLAYDKVTTYKGTTRNHFLGQVVGFRIGDKNTANRADDVLDAFVYSVAIALGNPEGF